MVLHKNMKNSNAEDDTSNKQIILRSKVVNLYCYVFVFQLMRLLRWEEVLTGRDT